MKSNPTPDFYLYYWPEHHRGNSNYSPKRFFNWHKVQIYNLPFILDSSSFHPSSLCISVSAMLNISKYSKFHIHRFLGSPFTKAILPYLFHLTNSSSFHTNTHTHRKKCHSRSIFSVISLLLTFPHHIVRHPLLGFLSSVMLLLSLLYSTNTSKASIIYRFFIRCWEYKDK